MPDLEEMEWERYAFAEKVGEGAQGFRSTRLKAASSAQLNIVILGLHDAGFTMRQIERYTGIGKSTVSRIVRAYAQVNAQTEGSK